MSAQLITHICLDVTSFKVSLPFYDAIFSALGWKRVFNSPSMIGYGPTGFTVGFIEKGAGETGRTGRGGTHVAFAASSKQAVDDWYSAAIANGAKGDGEPGLRTKIAPNYYAAYALDPDGYRLEVIHFVPKDEE